MISNDITPSKDLRKLFDFFNTNRWIYIQDKGLIKSLRYCSICNQYKLPRMAHSQLLNRSVYRMDHHCLIVNNSIGYRNYHIFVQFVFSIFLVQLYKRK